MRYKLHLLHLLFLFYCASSFAQPGKVTGRVLSDDGTPLPGASVTIKHTDKATIASSNGSFTISVSGKTILVANSVGYESKEIEAEAGQTIEIRLSKNVLLMNEVVVTALGVKREKRNLTYSTQEVKGDQLVATKEPNVINALEGKVSGVQITSSSGTPGSSSRIVIRGTTSIYGDNEALIVIDGVPVNNDETGNLYSGPGSNRLIDIDPSIIENVNILKGAAATALYGSAGQRGVIMITTKSGGDRRPVITFSSDIGFEKPILPEKQMKYSQGNRGVFFNGENQKTSLSWGALMDTLKINGQPAPKYDPYDLFFQKGVTNNNTVSVNGGSNSSNYFFSYSYYDQKGTVPKTSLFRHSIFTKYSNRITKNLSSTFQFTYSNTRNNRMPEGYILESPIWTVYAAPVSWNPLPYLNPDGTQRVYRFSRNNPFWVLDNIYNKSLVNRFIPLMSFNYTPLNWLTLTERIGADIYAEDDKYREGPSSALATPGRIIEQNTNFRQFNHDFIISANKQFNKINLNLILGNNIFSTYSQYHYEKGTGLTIDNFDNISGASTITASETHYQQRKVGFYAQANVDYKRWLNLSLTGRYDGSSVLSSDKNFYPYGSVAGSFIFSELLHSDFLNFGKLRVSYATVGNDNVGPYSLQTPYVPVTIGNITFPYEGQAGFLLSSTLGNPKLKNERLNEYEVGLEAKMLNNKIGVEASYFYRKTINGLIPGVPIAPSTGYTGTTVNTASIENKGIEVLVNANPIKLKRFSWDLTFNFTRIRNKVLELYPGTDQLGNGFTQVIVGQPYGVKFGGRFKRAPDGQLMIDAAGLPFRDDNDGIVGNITPDWLAGLSNTFRYGPFTLSFSFDMKKGGDIENNVDGYGFFYGTPKVTENRKPQVIKGISVVDGKPNTVKADMQDYYQTRLSGILEAVIQDGTYIKLRTVNLGFDLPVSMMKRTPFKTASLVLTGRNLWIHAPHFDGGDPETSSFGSSNGAQGIFSFSTPTSRSLNLSLKFSF